MSTNNVQLKRGTAAAFANVATKDPNTIYFITDTNRIYVGDSEYSRPVLYSSEAPSETMPQGTLYIREVTENSITRQQLYYSNGSTWTAVNIEPESILTEAIVVGNDGNVTPTAVTTTFKVPTITVDTKGRVSSAVERTIDLVNFMPKKGGTFTGDVVVDADLTADSIKTDGTIEITSNNTERINILGTEQTTNTTTVLFKNNLGTAATPIKIEAKYRKENSNDDSSYLGVRANQISLGGKVVDIRGDVAIWGSTSTSGPITINAGDYAGTAATQRYVDNAIASALSVSDAMVLKGTLGTNGTVTAFNNIDLTTAVKGDTYKVITSDVLPAANSSDSTDHILTPGDLIVYMGEDKFIYVPSGDEDVTSVKVAGSGDTINVSTTAQTGTVVLGDAAAKKVSTSTILNGNGASDDNVPTELAVKTYVDDTNTKIGVTATTRNNNPYWGTISGTLSSNLSTTPSNGTVVLGSAAAKDVMCEFGPANLHSGNKHDNFLPSAGAVFDLVNNYKTCIALHNPQSDKNINVPNFNPEFAGAPDGGGAKGLIILGSTAGKDATTSISDTDNLIPTSKAIKTYVDDSIEALTDTKVTTVTTSGDGNAVTGGDISEDGATLTLTKGESFIPVSGGTFTGAVTLAGAPTTDLNAATKKYVDDSISAAALTWGTL